MKISKTPLRMSFLGGGTDFPWFIEEHGGAVISSAIDRYIYISALKSFEANTTYLKYSSFEQVSDFKDIQHPIFRTVLEDSGLAGHDFSVMADIPGGTGLGSSSAFTVGLIHVVEALSNRQVDPKELAERAIDIELNKLGEPIGIQDHLPPVFGGTNYFEFSPAHEFKVVPVDLELNNVFDFVLVPTERYQRSASETIRKQIAMLGGESKAIKPLLEMLTLTKETFRRIATDPFSLTDGLNEAWKMKKASNPRASSERVEEIIQWGRRRGALAGKLLGAGDGGFVLLVFEKGSAHKIFMSPSSAHRLELVEVSKQGSEILDS